MKKLTQKEAIRLHRKLWGWLAEHPNEEKYDWPGWEEFGKVDNDCFLCEYHVRHEKDYCGGNCLIDWGPGLWCQNGDSPYWKWYKAETEEERTHYARLVRDAPARKRKRGRKARSGD